MINRHKLALSIQRRRLQVATDLANHFSERVALQYEDILDTAELAGVSPDIAVGLTIRKLVELSIRIAIATGGSKRDYLDFCSEVYSTVRAQESPTAKKIVGRSFRPGKREFQ